MQIEKIIAAVLVRLKHWEKAKINIAQKDMLTYDERLFTQARTVRIQGIDQAFFNILVSGESHPYKSWLQKATIYGIIIELELFDYGEPWLCYEQLGQIDYSVFSACGKRLIYVAETVICYQDVALIPPFSMLCKYHKQPLTSLASEAITKQKIKVRERK